MAPGVRDPAGQFAVIEMPGVLPTGQVWVVVAVTGRPWHWSFAAALNVWVIEQRLPATADVAV